MLLELRLSTLHGSHLNRFILGNHREGREDLVTCLGNLLQHAALQLVLRLEAPTFHRGSRKGHGMTVNVPVPQVVHEPGDIVRGRLQIMKRLHGPMQS